MKKETYRITTIEKVTGKQKSVRVPSYIIDFYSASLSRSQGLDFDTCKKIAISNAKVFFEDHSENQWSDDASDYICKNMLREFLPPYKK